MNTLQTLVSKYLKDHVMHKKYLAVIMALSIVVSLIVPLALVMPAIGLTNTGISSKSDSPKLTNYANEDGNIVGDVVYSPREMELITLLFGKGESVNWLEGCTTVEEALTLASNRYLLGIASDFSVFVENDFTATEADSEGRVAVGGDLSFTKDWNYQVGSGDYAAMTALTKTDNYLLKEGFAHALCGGKMYRINTLSSGKGRGDRLDLGKHTANKGDAYSYSVFFDPEDDLFKRFIVGNIEESLHLSEEHEDVPYTSEPHHNHNYPGDCGEDCPHEYLESVNELAQIYEYDGIKEIIYSAFSKIRSRSRSLANMAGINVNAVGSALTLTVPDGMQDSKTIFFDIGDTWNGYSSISFENVPEGANLIVNCSADTVGINGDVATFINGERISNSGDIKSNNNKASEQILYNFYHASEVNVNGNFNGTILAPNADVKSRDDACPGHLSGALIAKSFYGGLEIGYRPYQGGSDILELATGYYVPVDKLVTGTNIPLSGARLVAENIVTGEAVFDWTSDGSTTYVSLPSMIDFTGATDYRSYSAQGRYKTFESRYTLYEKESPEGFFGTEKQYRINVTETLDVNDLMINEGRTYPKKVSAVVEIFDTNDNKLVSWHFDIADDHNSYDADLERSIKISDGNGSELGNFKISIERDKESYKNAAINKIFAVTNDTQQIIDIDITKPSVFEYNGTNFYFDPDVLILMPLTDVNLTVENTPGLLFRKIDDSNHDVYGAEIQLYEGEKLVTNSTVWSWNDSTSTQLIDPKNLKTDVLYRFHEKTTPEKYETAGDISFEKIDDTHIRYWSDKTDREGVLLDLTQSREIKMVDKQIYGAKLTLSKVDYVSQKALDGATFSLYSNNDTLIFSGFNGNEIIFENEEFKKISNAYVKNGELKPGVYYLTENVIPEHKTQGERYENPGRIYFTVTDDFEIKSGYAETQRLTFKNQTNPNILHVAMSDGNLSISNVRSIKFTVQSWNLNPNLNFYSTGFKAENFASDCTVKKLENSWLYTYEHTFDEPIDIQQFEVQNWTDNKAVLTYVEINTSDGKKYLYSENDDQSSIAYSNQNPMLAVSGEMLTVSNRAVGETTSISVRKAWQGDKGFEYFRKPVTVKLYQSKTKLDDPKTQITESMAYKDTNGKALTVELSDKNKWKASWSGIPASYVQNGAKRLYYYYIKETDVPDCYIDSYSLDPDGTILVTNTFDSIKLNVQKIWDTKNNSDDIIPNSIVLRLQWKNDNGDWEDVPNQRIILIKSYGFKGTFKNLPAGKVYRVIEPTVPTGWKIKTNSEETNKDNDTLSIENELKLGSLEVSKNWLDDSRKKNKRPDTITLGIYRATQTLWPKGQPTEEVLQDYARLLQYSLYFYDGNMCGDGVNENSVYPWRNDCHTEDEVTGGFHDAGDHVMFGLPAGFSASTLGWSLYEYRDDYDALGQTPHHKIITDYYSDFFMKCVKLDAKGNVKEILVQKGHGNTDHAYWGIPEGQPDRSDQIYWVSDTGSDIAAEYAAALTLSYLNFHTTDETRYGEYLKMAKKLYEYSERIGSCLNEVGLNIDETDTSQYPGYYQSNDYKDDQAWAAAWLAVASKGTSDANLYKQKCQTLLSGSMYDWGGFHWNNVKYGAMCVNAAYLGGSWTGVKQFVEQNCVGTGYLNQNDWGCSRYNTGYQTIALVAAKHEASGVDATKTANWCKSQMNYILGDNAYNACFVTNFAENATKKPHYRAGSGQIFDMTVKNDTTIIDSYEQDANRLIGALVGGPPSNNDVYEDVRSDYQRNEVATDYNANLAGAAAGLYHFFKTGATYEIPGVKTQYLQTTTPNVLYMANASNEIALKAAATVEESYTMSWTGKTFSVDYALPSEISDKVIKKVDLYFTDPNLNGVFRYNGWSGQVSLSYNSAKKQTVEIGQKLQSIAFENWYGSWNVQKVVFYYDVENSFAVSPQSKTVIMGDTAKLNIDGISDIANIKWDNSNVKWNSTQKCWYFNAGAVGNVTVTGVASNGKVGTFSINVIKFEVTPSSTTIPEAESGVLMANGSATWSANSDKVTLSPSSDGSSCIVTVNEFTSSDVIITAKHSDSQISTVTVKVTAGTLKIINSPIKVHVAKTAEVKLNLIGGDVSVTVLDSKIAGVQNGKILGKRIGQSKITVSRNGSTAEGIVNVIEPMTITGDNIMNIGDTIKLVPKNQVGEVSWNSQDESIATVDANGNVTSKNYGGVTITATDSDGTKADYRINVQVLGVKPKIPEDKELVKIVTLSKDDNWSMVINDLMLIDKNGDRYYYYIAELDNNGSEAVIIDGKGAQYIPVSYENNGAVLSDNETIGISVSNELSVEMQGMMPSTGGTGTNSTYVLGCCIICFGGVLWVIRKLRTKESASDEE